MTARRPLSTLLSQLLVAFTIEFDNEAERQIKETNSGRRFLVSLVMWSNLMRFVDDAGVRVRDVPARAGVPGTPATSGWIHACLAGMQRWGYIVIAPDPTDPEPKPRRAGWIIRPTRAGRTAQDIWRPLAGAIEQRWRERFGADAIERLRASLLAIVAELDVELPRYLPVLSHGMQTSVPHLAAGEPAARTTAVDPRVDLSALLSQVLLVLTVNFERDSKLSLAMSANVLRVLTDDGIRMRDLPLMTGVSKEAISASVGFLERRGVVIIEADPTASRGKQVRLTPRGSKLLAAFGRQLVAVEAHWDLRFGRDKTDALRKSLHAIVDQHDGHQPRLSLGLIPPPGCWRANKPYVTQTRAVVADPSARLPHHPMVLHRGGFPDGS